jgi:peptidoglycan/LPS O-acetylase OafA/YrhL
MLMFVGGNIAALLVRYRNFRQFAGSGLATVVATVSIGTAFALFPTAFAFVPFVLLTVFFCIVAGGNDLFGLLSRPAAQTLGEISYGVYLLHGLMLYSVFDLIVGMNRSRTLSPFEHWTIVIAIVPPLLLICRTTFRFIEYPAMQNRLRMRLS